MRATMRTCPPASPVGRGYGRSANAGSAAGDRPERSPGLLSAASVASQAIGQSVQSRSDKGPRSRVTQLAPPFPEGARLSEFEHGGNVVGKPHSRNVPDPFQATQSSLRDRTSSPNRRYESIGHRQRAALKPPDHGLLWARVRGNHEGGTLGGSDPHLGLAARGRCSAPSCDAATTTHCDDVRRAGTDQADRPRERGKRG